MKQTVSNVITVTLNPAADRTLYFSHFTIGEVNRVENEQIEPGGKGINVARIIKQLDYDVTVTGFLGEKNQTYFTDFFEKNGITDKFVRLPGSTRINIKLVDQKSNQVSEINFPGQSCTDAYIQKLITVLKELASPTTLVILSGSLPPGVPDTIYYELITHLNGHGCKVFLDASGQALAEGIKAKPFLIKPNISELKQILNDKLEDEIKIKHAINELLNTGISQVVVSMGGKGSLMADKSSILKISPPKVPINSTVGAGDSMVAGLAIGHLKNLPFLECGRLATAIAATSVAFPGAQIGSLKELSTLMTKVIIEKEDF